ncbi:RING finger protein [Talaromyces stipitatus ATCC 10500]|uniref:RING-type E3 ubiquitin transferase n=1 Tax=Talaromyces stipitatus (strain ATCC 10500 / CBS 375.48 / QM 6759 / NRRL 1006) TaxID=441959 RepID=B8ME35_TALSN|nr:RING finger protein [Talaromyces stipitatus ATCC 10500]EED16112.1 RING finger protein [Talaromyces stipitatus ATCC 10500]
MRLAAYAGVSATLAAGVILKALHQRSNFYAAAVYLSQSSANLMILTNLFLVATGYFLYGLQRLLYGRLRPIETEQLYEKAWFAVTETCLAMTIFRGELGVWFLVMFVCLLVGKVWGWIGEGRVEILEQQPPANPRLFHARLATSLVLSVVYDILMLDYAVRTVLESARADMMVMFGFEFAILTILSTSTLARYCISLVEIYIKYRQKMAKLAERRAEIRSERERAIREHRESGAEGLPANLLEENDVDEMELDIPGWEEKGRWVFYLDLITDFCKLVVYLTFFAILFTFYGLPIHILRDVVVTIRSFGRRLVDFMKYRTATRDMNERYPDATAEEITREDVCIICREEMTPWQQPAADGHRRIVPERLRPKKLPCGHILHFSCLRSWLERQQNCPMCRRPVVVPRNQQYPANNGNHDGRANAVPGAQLGPNQAAPVNNVAGGGQPQARIYQFGPFRIGFGAGRGDVFRNLHQQIHGNNPPPVNIPPGAQQIGFGFGFGGRPHQPQQILQAPHAAPQGFNVLQPEVMPTNLASIQQQLANLEQQISQEYQSLRATAEQLHVLRALQTELQRLRTAQQNLSTSQPPESHSTSAAIPPTSAATTTSTLNNTVPTTIHHLSGQSSSPIPAGDSRLPPGLTLPPGWTLTPLRRVEPSSNTATAGSPATASIPPSVLDPRLFEPLPPRASNDNQLSDTTTSTQDNQLLHVSNNESNPPTETEKPRNEYNRISPSFQWGGDRNTDSQHSKKNDIPADSSSSQNADAASSSDDKGKARATTVEDLNDEGED